MIKKSFCLAAIALTSSLLAASAGELFYTDGHDGSIWRFDTGSLEHERVIWGHDIPNNISSGPTGLVFRTPNTLFISADGNFNGEAALHHYHYDAEILTRISTRKTVQNMWRLSSAVLNREGTVYMPSLYADRIWEFGSDAYQPDANGVHKNVGPFPTERAATGKYSRHIAYSWIDGRLAVSHQGGVYLFTTGGGTVSFERDISIPGIHSVGGIAFDYDGLAVLDSEGQEIGRKSLLYIINQPTMNILRFDATTGDPLGANPEDPTDPVFISTADGGFVELGQFGIDPADGHFYISNRNQHHRDQWGNVGGWVLSRFSRTGSLLNPVALTGLRVRQMAFRPTVRQMEILADGDYVLGPDGFAVKAGTAGVWFQAALNVNRAVMDFFGDGYASFAGDVTVGGDASGNVTVQLRDGSIVKTIRLKVESNGGIRVIEKSTMEVDGGADVSGGTLDIADGTLQLNPGADIGTAVAAIASNGGRIIAAGGGNIISTGGGNIISTGGGNIISTGGGNIISTGGGNIIAAGGGNIISTGGGNIAPQAASSSGLTTFSEDGQEGLIQAVDADIVAQDGGTIVCETGGRLDARTVILEGGGSLSTGDAPAVARLSGNLFAHSGSSILVKLGGLSQGTEYDLYSIEGGSAVIDGRLAVSLADDFGAHITAEDSFTVLTADGGIAGTIENLSEEGRLNNADGSGSFSVRLAADGKSLLLEDFQPAAPFDAWKSLHFSSSELLDPSISGNFSDPDNDGASNLAEFAFDLNPREPDSARTVMMERDEGQALRLTYRRRIGGSGSAADYVAAGIRYQVEESLDLRSWETSAITDGTSNTIEITPEPDGRTETVTILLQGISASATSRFYRVQVTSL